ncbi:hypothetical protein BC830DRAFT_1122606 [Chytriomyces sp. MP71]|nr:hypothetical protein BC830DRAFT_1122606 [Chytriomyces sp. MP71]
MLMLMLMLMLCLVCHGKGQQTTKLKIQRLTLLTALTTTETWRPGLTCLPLLAMPWWACRRMSALGGDAVFADVSGSLFLWYLINSLFWCL